MGEDYVGLERRISGIEIMIHGSPGEFGMKNKVDLMWRVHALPLLALGALIGSLATLLAARLMG